MVPELINNFIKQVPEINDTNIISFNIGIKPSTGERYMKLKTIDGMIYIKTLAQNGIVDTRCLKIPPYYTVQQRDELIRYLKTEKGLIQVDIADYLGISQGTVSNVLRKLGLS